MVPRRVRFLWWLPVLLAGLLVPIGAGPADATDHLDKKAIQAFSKRWFKARPWTRFERWDPVVRSALLEEARAIGPVPEGSLETVRDLLWKAARKAAPKLRKDEIETPYGTAEWDRNGRGGKKSGLLIGLHGGGEGAGNKSEAAGNWSRPGHMGIYPQGIRLVHDTWNTVHGEAFVLTLIELAKVRYEIDPDRVYVAGFSMGGTGSFHMAGRHPDLLAGAIPAHGVLMAAPKSQVESLEEIEQMQYGILPNVRNLPVYFYTGRDDRNCRPWTFVYGWDLLQELKADDPGGYEDIRFRIWPDLAHSFPPGEPSKGLKWIAEKRRDTFPEKLVWEYASDPFPLPDAEDRDKARRLPKYWFYWLYCIRPADAMAVTAVRKGNEFDLSVTLAFPDDFTIYLNPEMIDVTKDVVVRVEGKEVWRGKPEPDFVTILESLDARLDRRMVFDRKVTIPEPD